MKKVTIFVSALMVLLLLGACVGGTEEGGEVGGGDTRITKPNTATDTEVDEVEALEGPREPVELTIVPHWLAMTDEDFENLMFEPLRQVHPHITMKVNRTAPAELAVSGEFPDIFYTANVQYFVFNDMDIPYDISEMVRRSQLDLEAFSSPNIDWVIELGSDGELFGLPFDLNHYAMFYNKDIFDQRGVDYPVDGMTFEEVLALSRELTFNDGEVQFRGYVPPSPNNLSGRKTLPYYDPINKIAVLNTEEQKANLELLRSFYEIPGMILDNQYPIQNVNFVMDQTVAMYSGWLTDTAIRMMDNKVEMNFDIVSDPSFSDLPGVIQHSGAKMLGISKVSQHKEDAFLALQVWTSPEVQAKINRGGRLTVLDDDEIRKDFGADIPVLNGKNIQGALGVQPAKMIPPHEYNVMISRALDAVQADLARGTKDINTLLREAQEAADQGIAEAEASKSN